MVPKVSTATERTESLDTLSNLDTFLHPHTRATFGIYTEWGRARKVLRVLKVSRRLGRGWILSGSQATPPLRESD